MANSPHFQTISSRVTLWREVELLQFLAGVMESFECGAGAGDGTGVEQQLTGAMHFRFDFAERAFKGRMQVLHQRHDFECGAHDDQGIGSGARWRGRARRRSGTRFHRDFRGQLSVINCCDPSHKLPLINAKK